MTACTAFSSSNQIALSRSLIQTYLAELPVLDRRVLYHRYSEKKDAATISHEMEISQRHVERILARARDFGAYSATAQSAPAPFPVWTRSPLAA